MSKALSQTQLDQPLSTDDRERLLAYLRRFGALDQQRQYRGSPRRSGYHERSARSRCVIYSAAISTGADKIGLQFRRRFWEEEDSIHGGRTWTDQEIGQIIYPSHDFQRRKGILVGYFMDFKRTMRERTSPERQRMALEQGARIHPQYTTEFETAFSVSWPRVPWSRRRRG
jgi:monoamine oxidase